MMNLLEYLGADVSRLLSSEPFSGWAVKRSIDSDLPRTEVRYEFVGRGVEVICDDDERVRTIFIHAGADESLSGIPFGIGRQQVLDRFGPPESSGAPTRLQFLDEYGPWDRFLHGAGFVHVQYRVDADEISTITHMRPDAAPPRR